MSTVERNTTETQIRLSVTPGAGRASVDTGDGFLDHMLTVLARYGGLDLEVKARGDLRHHLIEDVAIALGTAIAEEVPATAVRYGSALVPMDDALVQAAVDVGGRAYYGGALPSPLYQHFLMSLAVNMKSTVHVHVIRGDDPHHVVEAAVKAVGFSLSEAMTPGERVFSTKGAVDLKRVRDEGVLDEGDELG